MDNRVECNEKREPFIFTGKYCKFNLGNRTRALRSESRTLEEDEKR